jgi:two-component system sensor histidine kinase YesM
VSRASPSIHVLKPGEAKRLLSLIAKANLSFDGKNPSISITPILSGKVDSKRGNGIGLKNTTQRIKLYYGEDFGITCKSTPQEGTTIEVRIKAVIYDTIGS